MNDLRKIVISLDGAERNALAALAARERRDARAQAALLIRTELERLGLLPRAPMTANGAPALEGEITNAKTN